MKNKFLLLLISILIFTGSCSKKAEQGQPEAVIQTQVNHARWTRDAVIYEVNIRQYTPEGTFNAFAEHLPRLKKLGVDILWLMPIHPIGEKNRKGKLGSYYSVKNYKGINPEYGTLDDFKNLVKLVHDAGMHIIIDWVANHTAWDNSWMTEHPEFYKKDSTGNFFGPYDWTDVAQLDYDNKDLHAVMIDAMEYWINETDIDGFRCDVAGLVPVEFWEEARSALDKIKPVFMLAENEDVPELLEKAFDMNYGWELHHIMNQIAKGEENVENLKNYFHKEDSIYSKDCYRMQFITNHDENSWNGTEFERLGDGVEPFAVLTFIVPGMPLLYTGQEVGLKKRLAFFTKDTVPYKENKYTGFYTSLIKLKKDKKVLWNGTAGGDFEILSTGNENVFAFRRYNTEEELFTILNLSAETQNIKVPSGIVGAYNDYFSEGSVVMNEGEELTMEPWAYKVLLEK